MLLFRRALQLTIEMTHAGRIVVNPDNKSPYRLVKATLSVLMYSRLLPVVKINTLLSI